MKKFVLILALALSVALSGTAFAQMNFNGQILPYQSPVAQSSTKSQAGAEAVGVGSVTSPSTIAGAYNQPFFPLSVNFLPGLVGDCTDQLPDIAGLHKLVVPYIHENGDRKIYPGETIDPTVRPIVISWAGFLGMQRIKLEDIVPVLIDEWNNVIASGKIPKDKIAYRVYYKSRSKTLALSSGGQGGGAAITGSGVAAQGSGGAVVGWGSNSTDPKYYITFYKLL